MSSVLRPQQHSIGYTGAGIPCAVHVRDCCRMSHKRSQRGDWREGHMKAAIKKVKSKQLSVRKAAQAYCVSKSTLARRSAGKNKFTTGAKKHFGRYLPDFPPDYEAELGEYILEMESRFFGPTYMDGIRVCRTQCLLTQFRLFSPVKAEGCLGLLVLIMLMYDWC